MLLLRLLIALVLCLFGVFATACSPNLHDHQTTQEKVLPSAAGTVNINTASFDELQKIPNIGDKLAARIIAYREANGPFRRVEHLMLVSGISEKRFREMRRFVRTE